ncbi:phosphoenolpyruvate carboxykinase (ATP) [candidate division KSB1 bacterium]|nr:phosphoenolpyruvate carboxykinase (ATP) [candidate division KSB1 bacterium]
MATPHYDENVYRQFNEKLRPLLDGPNVMSMTLDDLRKHAILSGRKTEHGAYGWRSMISSRIAPKTVYLGSPDVQLPRPTNQQKDIIEAAPEQLERVLHYMKTLPFVHLRRRMGDNGEYNPICNIYVSVNDPKNYRIPYMWGNTLFEADNRPGPKFTMIHIPEEHQMRQQVLTIPEHNLNICLGSDYMGEEKKGFLRQAMWRADQQDMLGLHAGTKTVYIWDEHENRMKTIGVFLFGLTATGKSTWACHQLGLDETKNERTEVNQDDIVFLRRDGSAYGSEAGFYVKTDVDRDLQEAMYYALDDPSALYENVMIDYTGKRLFLDESLCANGRAIIRRDKLRIKRRNRFINIDAPSINLPPLDELDGILFAFITRRNTIMPFSQRLTPEQAVLAYLWGESTHSYASQPVKAGESVRIVGTDPFIVGSRAAKVNRFYDIIMQLVEQYPGKVQFYQYNTGGMGEIIIEYRNGDTIRKRVERNVERVPIELMAAIQRGDLHGTNDYEPGRLGTEEIIRCASAALNRYDAKRYYTQEQIEAFVQDIVDGRREFTEQIADEGLAPEIMKAAEMSFAVAR